MIVGEIDVTVDVLNGFLNRYAHRVTDNYNILVRCSGGDTSFYAPDRELIIVGQINGGAIDLTHSKAITLHECGHAIYTPRALGEVLKKLRPGVRNLWNLLEDGRIELLLMNKVPKGLELLTLMNEKEHAQIASKCSGSMEQVWRGFWELAKLGKARSRVRKPDDGLLTAKEVKRRIEAARPIIASGRYECDPWEVVGMAKQLWALVEDIFEDKAVLLVVRDPQAYSDGDGGREVPAIAVDVGGDAVPEGLRGQVEVRQADRGRLDEEEGQLRREIEKELRELSDANARSHRELESAVSRAVKLYQNATECPRFNGKVKVHTSSSNEAEYEKLRAEVAPIARKLEKALADLARKQLAEESIRGVDRGSVDPPLAHRSAWGDKFVFRRTAQPREVFPAVMVLVDESGSMHDCKRYLHAQRAAIAVHEALRTLGVSHAIAGFTTDHNEKAHHVYPYIEFGEKTTRSRSARLAGITSRDCNRDGLALKIAGEYLRRQRAERKLLLVISDGLPNTKRYNGSTAVNDSRRMVMDIERWGGFVYCLYLGDREETYVPRIYSHHAFVDRLEDLPANITGVIREFVRSA